MAFRRCKGVLAPAVVIALLWLTTACADQRQVPVDAPSVAPPTQSTISSATAGAASRSPVPEPEQAPSSAGQSATSPSAEPSPSPSASKLPAAMPPDPGEPSGNPKAAPLPSGNKFAAPSSPAPIQDVTISVVGNAGWGDIVAAESVALKKNDSLADVLIRVLKTHKLAFDKSGSGAMFYVRGIDGLSEFDDGPTSGWKFRVNGKVPGVGAGSYGPKAGDRIEWFYTSEDADAKADANAKESAP